HAERALDLPRHRARQAVPRPEIYAMVPQVLQRSRFAQALRPTWIAQSGGPQAGGSRMHRARNPGHPWPHHVEGSPTPTRGVRPAEGGALGDGEAGGAMSEHPAETKR